MSDLKTQKNDASVTEFLEGVDDPHKRQDSYEILKMMQQITGKPPSMWGPSIIGFGSYHYKYASGREGDWFQIGFSPRKQNLTLYFMDGVGKYQELLGKLGKHSIGKGCLYIKKLEDVDLTVLKRMIAGSVAHHAGKGTA